MKLNLPKKQVVSVAIDNFGIVNKEEITKLYDFLRDEIWRDPLMRLSKFLTEDLETKTVNLTLTFDERSELLRHLEMFDEHIDQLHPLVESVQDKLLGID